MNTGRIAVIAIALTAICVFGCRPGKVPNDPKATQVIDKMASAYATCQTYYDSGTVTTLYHSDDGDQSEIKQFSTAMIRPHEFRFEFNDEHDSQSRYIVWQNRDDVRTWWDLNQRSEREESLGMALAGATGVSGGSAHTIPSLLLPNEIGGRKLTDIEAAKLGENKPLGDHVCLTIEAVYAGNPITIWIDEQTFLVRRIDSTTAFDDFTTTETTIYDPVVNVDIDPKRLEYNAPRS
jgi:outer membrane lipoprotein-sorting protein